MYYSKPKASSKTEVGYDLIDGQLQGFAGEDKKSPIWTFRPNDGERILSVTSRPTEDPVAQIGVVLVGSARAGRRVVTGEVHRTGRYPQRVTHRFIGTGHVVGHARRLRAAVFLTRPRAASGRIG